MTLMEAIARTERDIAGTLQHMTTHSEGKKAARRRRLAGHAIQGAHEATSAMSSCGNWPSSGPSVPA